MTAVHTARKRRQTAIRRRAERERRAIHPDPAELGLGLLIDPRRLTQPGVLELMRVAAGLGYGELGQLVGIRRAHVMQLLRGLQEMPRHERLDRIRDACWERISRRPLSGVARHVPDLLTVEEVARLLAVQPIVARRLAVKHPELGAVKIGVAIRFPSANLAAFISSSERPAESGGDETLSTEDVARLLRVSRHVVRYQRLTGSLPAVGRGRGFRFPLSAVRRVMERGTHPLRPHQGDLPHNRRRSGGGRER